MTVEKSGSNVVTKNETTIERKSDRELVITRTFNGPATMVFDAWTKPELVMRWWCPRSTGMELTACEIDLRVGGKYRYEFSIKGEKKFTAFGTYKEVERGARLASTDEEQNAADDEAVTTTTFTEKAGKTTVIVHQLFASKEALDESMHGLGDGTRESYEQLDAFLASSKS